MLLLEAVYSLVGLAASELASHVSFNQFFQRWSVDLQQKEQWYQVYSPPVIFQRAPILQKRVIWAIGKWVMNIPADSHPLIYQVTIPLLSNADMVVALSAANTLRSGISNIGCTFDNFTPVIDEISFKPATFSPFLPQTLEAIFALIARSNDAATILRLLNVISVLLQQVGQEVSIIYSIDLRWLDFTIHWKDIKLPFFSVANVQQNAVFAHLSS